MCKRSVLVGSFKLPGLFTFLLLITLSAITKPGVCNPRFVHCKNVNKSKLAQKIAAIDSRYPGRDAILAIGSSAVEELQTIFPEARPSFIAGGVIVDLSNAEVQSLQRDFPQLVISDLYQALLPGDSNEQTNEPGEEKFWNYQMSGASILKETFAADGTNRSIGVVALDYSFNHSSLVNKIKVQKLFGPPADTDRENQTEPEKGLADLHLVHPLGILAGNEPHKFSGIAPEAEIRLARLSKKAVKAITLLDALEWLISQETPPDAILLCTDFGAPVAVQRALFACRNAGIIPIVSAGNNPHQITGMAALPCCVTVGALDRWKQRTFFSGCGPAIFQGQEILKPDCMEPGLAVLGPTEGNQYKFGSGTLQAAAHFAGIFLLAKEALPPGTDPEIIVNALLAKTDDLGNNGQDFENGYGLPLPLAAIYHVLYPPEDK
jgi:subtilisin family serine protease